MSIKHALLALLAEEPGYGYELKKRYDAAVGLLWPLQQAQVYNNLRLLQQEGLVELDCAGCSGKPTRSETLPLDQGRPA